ncbi:MinD/ParA family ATP-binding protein, partial [Sinomonas sp.]|uniref:MinD/ParA family ATP-binding protein n=1 Tax=Sinomonas sp. TaxID=1914986 RepID=UPI003FA6A9D0
LGDRSIPANHDHTAIDLLANVDRFANPGNAHELQDYIRPQGENRFHVLASQNNAANREVIDGAAFVQLHHVLRSFYHLIVVDTGNASTASTWQAAVGLSDELVLVAMAKEDSVKTLAATVDTLVDDGMQDKLARGVLLLTEPPLASKNRKAHLELLERTREHFSDYVRAVVVLPFDPALDNGGPIVYHNLSAQSKEAWLKATAEIMKGL